MIENDTPTYGKNTQIENVENHIYLGQRYSTRDKNQDKAIQRKIKAGYTVFAKHKSTAHAYFPSRNDIRRVNVGTQLPSKEEASSSKNKDGKEYVNIHTGTEKGNGHRRDGTSQKKEVDMGRTGHVSRVRVTDGICVSPPENPTKRKDLGDERLDVGETK